MNLLGKVALVTGGAKRIGRALALGLASRGAHVAITYNTSEKEALETVRAIRRRGVRGLALRADQRDPSQVRRAVADLWAAFPRVDILINNASSFYPTPIDEATEEQWEDLIQANLSGPWRFAQALGPEMKRRKRGKIINIVDTAAFRPWTRYLPYCAAKGGLVTLTWGLARALAPHVQVNGIAPGPVLFPPGISRKEKRLALNWTLLKREGSPGEIVRAALFLIESDYVTGVILPVDGGRMTC